MANLQDIINLAKADGGKVFVIDEKGDLKLVILPVAEYQHMLLGKEKKPTDEVEEINNKILKAQLEEPAVLPSLSHGPKNLSYKPEPVKKDLREEVIDLSFDFEGPRMDFDDL